jgi:hypothetical protein
VVRDRGYGTDMGHRICSLRTIEETDSGGVMTSGGGALLGRNGNCYIYHCHRARVYNVLSCHADAVITKNPKMQHAVGIETGMNPGRGAWRSQCLLPPGWSCVRTLFLFLALVLPRRAFEPLHLPRL